MTNAFSKIAKAALGLLVAVGVVAGASSALALTAADISMLQAAGIISASQAAALMASVGGSTTTTGTCYQFTTNLAVGQTSEAVRQLQIRLNENSATALAVAAGSNGSAGHETTYFGPATKTAVMKYQAMKGFEQVGSVGPMTRNALNTSCTTGPVTTTPPTQTGAVVAMLSTDNPSSSTLVAGQATADLAHFAFTGTGVVTNVTLQRIGVSADSTLSNLYLFDGANRLTDAASVTSNGMVSFNNPAGLFTVTGSTKTISVRSDIAGSTSGQTAGVKLVSFMTSGSSTAMTANVSGNIHSIASATLATVSAGTVTPSGATINPGTNVTVWQSTLNISTRDVYMKRFALRHVGSAPASSLQNFKLFVNGVQVATAAGIDSMGYVTFDTRGSQVLLASGARVVRVDADVVSGASRTVQFSLRQAADIDLVDSSFGVNITPTSTPWTAASALTISGTSGGTLTIDKDTTSPSQNVTLNGNDVNLGTFKVTAYGEAIKIETLTAGFTYTDAGGVANAAATLRNGRLLINGVQYGSSATLLAAGTTFTTNYVVMPGTSVLVEVHADVYDNDGTSAIEAGDTIAAKIIAGSSNAIRQDSLGSFNAPATAVTANTVTVAAAAITLARNNTYNAAQTTVLPATNFKIGSFNLAGSSVEDVLLTTLSFDIDEVVGTEFDEGDITNMYVVVKDANGTIVAQPSPVATLSAGGQDVNFSINYTLAKNSNLSLEVFANLSDDGLDAIGGAADAIDAADSFRTDLTVTGTSMVSGQAVTATSADTQGQTVAYGSATITATQDASSPVAAIVYDNQTVTSAAFKFATVTSGYNVTDLTLTIADASVVQNVMLYDGSTLVATRPGATTVTFSGLNWNVAANTNSVLSVRLQLGTVGIGAGSSGASLLTTLTAFTASSTSTGVSDVSANDAGPSIENNPAGNAMYVYAAIPTISTVALPSTTLATGTQTIAKFAVASNGGTIGWKKIIFTGTRAMGGTDTLSGTKLYDADTNAEVAGTVTYGGTFDADSDIAGTIIFVATNEQQISGTKTYVLKTTVAGTLADGDNINISIEQPSSYVVADDYTAVAATAASFVWSDISASGHDATSTTVLDWNNDYLVRNLPTDSQTLTK